MTKTGAPLEGDLQSLITKLKNIDIARVEQDGNTKSEALALVKKVTATLEGPVNRATDLVFRPYTSVAARIAVDLDLFKHIATASDTITSAELSTASGGDEVLIYTSEARVLRLMATADFVENPALDTWSANDTTRAMAAPPIAAGHRFVYDVLVSSFIKAPKFLRETKYAAPTEPTDGFVQYANQTKLNVFDYLQCMPTLFQDFNLFMGNTMGTREYWHDWYDVPSRLLAGFDRNIDPTLLIDIGGGKGHDLVSFDAAFGKTCEGALVLQDLAAVLDDVKDDQLTPKIEKMPVNFFEEQPVKGARAYFMHHILHDWSDKYCHMILKRVRAAMRPGYSKLLIHELILPDTGAAEIQARFDLVMMTFNGGMERSKAQWTKLLEDAGFVNVRLWEHGDADGIVEAEVA